MEVTAGSYKAKGACERDVKASVDKLLRRGMSASWLILSETADLLHMQLR